jgi:hypothetical protein
MFSPGMHGAFVLSLASGNALLDHGHEPKSTRNCANDFERLKEATDLLQFRLIIFLLLFSAIILNIWELCRIFSIFNIREPGSLRLLLPLFFTFHRSA